MQILLNGLSLHQPWSGIGWYTHILGNQLSKLGREVIYWGHTSAGSREDLKRDLAAVDRVQGKSLAKLRLIPHLQPKGMYRYLKLKRRPKNIVYHETNFIPRMWGFKTVATIHDLSILRYPELHPIARVKFMQKNLTEVAEKSEHIITISSTIKDEIRNILGVPESKITVTYLAAREIFHPRSSTEVASTLSKFGLRHRRFLLMNGNFEPRKNLRLILGAVNQMSAQDLGDFQLIHIGPQGWQNEDISDLVTHLKKSGRLRQLGYLSEPDLADLVSAARAMVFPSKYEGFGLPIVEAMASATPVITTNYGAMSEVAGGAAKLVSGTDEEELAQALCDIISDDEKFQSLQTAGIARAKHFSWQACAEQTLKVYETL